MPLRNNVVAKTETQSCTTSGFELTGGMARLVICRPRIRSQLGESLDRIEETQALETKLAGIERKLVPLQRALQSWTLQADEMRTLVDEAKGALGGPLAF